MSALEFQPWPKTARLNRDIVITEKIDGTNAAVVIVPGNDLDHLSSEDGEVWRLFEPDASRAIAFYDGYVVFAQSRNKFITPGKSTDNAGFAGWVKDNAAELVDTLGAGTHFGEWWGSGIQRGYGLTGGEKRFSLFNTARWATLKSEVMPAHTVPTNLEHIPGLGVVPILYKGPFSEPEIQEALLSLETYGSAAKRGYTRPEGIIIWHEAARQSFKVTLENDEAPKSAVDRQPKAA